MRPYATHEKSDSSQVSHVCGAGPSCENTCPPATLSPSRITRGSQVSPPRGIAIPSVVYPEGRRYLLFLSVFLGATSAMIYGTRPHISMGGLLRQVDLHTVFFCTVALIVVLVLAYLTNPSETSFRTYLTEQSFRQHLSRLDDNAQDEQSSTKGSALLLAASRRSPPISHNRPRPDFSTKSPFHFVNRASISLRTPKHVIHSFGILTIAAVLPSGSQPRGALPVEGLPSTVNDSWFIGAFGKWWRGGPIRTWFHDVIVNTKDAERMSSGILDAKALDNLECYDGLPFTSPSTTLHLPSTEPTAKLRGTERTAQRTINKSTRSTTPPPLPKSASLPLHAPRVPTSPPKLDRSSTHTPGQIQSSNVTDNLRLNTPTNVAYAPPPTSLFDQSPAIAEVLRQITQTRDAVRDLRAQLTDFRASAAESHSNIQADLEAQRTRKRIDDAARLELKTQTRALEDAKRAAEGGRRDAEKRLRAAESVRDNAARRAERLGQEISTLRARAAEDEAAVVRVKEEGEAAADETRKAMDVKRNEIKVTENVIAALNARAKELEEKIAQEEERLLQAKEQAELRKQDRSFYPLHVVSTSGGEETDPWSPATAYSQTVASDSLSQHNDLTGHDNFSPPALQVSPPSARDMGTTHPRGLSLSPGPKNLSLGGISNFHDTLKPGILDSNNDVFLQSYGQSIFDEQRSSRSVSTRFSPFSDSDADLSLPGGESISPRSTSLIPSSLISSLESGSSMEDMSRSFQSEDDAVMDPNWRSLRPRPPVEFPTLFTASPTAITNPSFDGVDQEDPFEIRPPPLALRRRLTADSKDMPRSLIPSPSRAISEQSVPQLKPNDGDNKLSAAHRRWHSADPKEKKGLNPEAKVFRLTKKSLPSFFPPQTAPIFEQRAPGPMLSALPAALSVPCAIPPPTSDSESLFSSYSMRAFAPSPAEREALQRALGGSTNTSLERLPTLSEVSLASMPPSPSHVHTVAAQRTPPGGEAGGRRLLPPGFAWLPLSQTRKPVFSPWEDEMVEGRKQGDGQ
ncbi:hypothetical protein IEO21_08143 [Rhodonia placenta]|uniref:Uncharacterized protein n=1 Tax=Rhodonia placenta TaxID=104341 RepID=A0A8H7NWQ4_9APHY|nr:hypothetical protein IEO21_08143 [Postia placenta]